MMRNIYLLSFTMITIMSGSMHAQTVLRGKVINETTGEPIIGAVVMIEGSMMGTTTDFDGEYILKTEQPLPLTLQISFVGFETKSIEINDATIFSRIKLKDNIIMDEIVVKENRVSNKQKESPLSLVTLDPIGIKQTGSISFYDGLGALKEVDLTSASFGFKVINTRGFNSTSPVRSLQLIDGVDNQAPGLNFSLGNFLGASELDVLKVDIIAGASGAFYGPSAFNGVISMETKSPFIHKGLSGMIRSGERNLLEGGIRYADAIKNKNNDDVFAYKINLYALRVNDWEANNYEPVTDSQVPADNPGGYNAVNIYGDEYYPRNDYRDSSGRNLYLNPGLVLFYRNGYKESDLVDYNTRNYKANVSLQYRIKPSLGTDSPLLIFSSAYGAGTTVYQGDNRFSLRNISFIQNKIEFSKRDKYTFRAYHSYENAGKSYDPYFTAFRLQELSKSNEAWQKAYTNYWFDIADIPDHMHHLGYPELTGVFPNTSFDFNSARQWLNNYSDSLASWHSLASSYANRIVEHDPAGTANFFVPGTPRFDSAFQLITSKLNNEQGGTRFSDKSSLYHVSGEYIFNPTWVSEIRVGGNYRLYTPNSHGTIFSDTAGTKITNSEIGLYAGIKKKFLNQKLIASTTIRFDKNENLNWIYTPAASLIYHPGKETYLRISFSSAVRNPTLTDQYLYLNVGPAILAGHIGKVENLITENSFKSYLQTGDCRQLNYFNIDAVRPEKVKTLEFGLRSSISNSVYIDVNYYRNAYRNFLGYLLGLSANIDCNASFPSFKNLQVYRYSANTENKVTTEGFSAGINYYFYKELSLNGNYSYNALKKTVIEDPIIPAYNTPEHKFNISLSGRNLKLSKSPLLRQVGFNINYKWVKGFRFEGSPQFTGYVPTYGTMDGQVNIHFEKTNTTLKVGSSNLLNNKHIETYGGPKTGRIAYISIAYNF